jgi:nicotinate dehydrogenase subunit B
MRRIADALTALARATCSRRAVLKGTGALIVGVSATHMAASLGVAQGPFATRVSHVDPQQLDAWLAIAADGTITAYTGKCEFGQGIQGHSVLTFTPLS